MMMQMIGSLAEFERSMLRERTNAGLEKTRKEGRVGGRRPKLQLMQQQESIRMVKSGSQTAADAVQMFNVHPATITRLLQKSKIQVSIYTEIHFIIQFCNYEWEDYHRVK